MTFRSTFRACSTAVGVALVASACAIDRAPTEQMAVAQSALANAGRAGGAATASPQFRSAQMKIDLARDAIRVRDHDRARMLAEEAEADANLAAAQARSQSAQRAADEVRAGVRALEESVARMPR